MGGCYSSDSQGALTSPRHKLPRDKPSKGSRKGKDLHYSPVITNGNGSASHNNDDDLLLVKSSSNGVSVECAVSTLNSYRSTTIDDERKGVAPSDSGIESLGSPQEELTSMPTEKREFTLCESCHHKLQRISRGSCHQCGNFRIDTSELTAMVNGGDTYCTCGPRQPGKQTSCRTHGVRGSSNANAATQAHRHSDIPAMVLKSNLRKLGRGDRDSKKVRMSWKSANSLDLNTNTASMNGFMDRSKSEASDVFRDDVSFRAPLAQFDSVDNHLGDRERGHGDREREEGREEEQCDAAFLASRMSIYSEILDLTDCICKCDYESHLSGQLSPRADTPSVDGERAGSSLNPSPCIRRPDSRLASSSPMSLTVRNDRLCLTEEEDEDSGHGRSKSDDRSGSTSDSELEVGEEGVERGGGLSSHSSPDRITAATVLESLPTDCDEFKFPVRVSVKGHEMVVMDAGTYTQMLEDLAMLKEQLSQLTQIIQEEEEYIEPLNLSLELDT